MASEYKEHYCSRQSHAKNTRFMRSFKSCKNLFKTNNEDEMKEEEEEEEEEESSEE